MKSFNATDNGWWTMDQISEDVQKNALYLAGGYDMCCRLLKSPRFNKPQREVIEEQAWDWKERAEHQGLKFEDSE